MWKPIETAPTNKNVLLWNSATQETVIGYRPEDSPRYECVIVACTASYADAWHPLPDMPEVSSAGRAVFAGKVA